MGTEAEQAAGSHREAIPNGGMTRSWRRDSDPLARPEIYRRAHAADRGERRPGSGHSPRSPRGPCADRGLAGADPVQPTNGRCHTFRRRPRGSTGGCPKRTDGPSERKDDPGRWDGFALRGGRWPSACCCRFSLDHGGHRIPLRYSRRAVCTNTPIPPPGKPDKFMCFQQAKARRLLGSPVSGTLAGRLPPRVGACGPSLSIPEMDP